MSFEIQDLFLSFFFCHINPFLTFFLSNKRNVQVGHIAMMATHVQDVSSLPPIEMVQKANDAGYQKTNTEGSRDPFGQIDRIQRLLPFYKIISQRSYPFWSYSYLKKGDKHFSISALRKQLSMLGFPLEIHNLFDTDLEETLKKFQRQTGLPQNGQITKSVWAMLHQKNKLYALETALKKWRRMAPYMKGRFVFINIPKYKLYAFDNHKLAFTQKVIVGRPSRPTPEFYPTWMTHIVLNPSWTLPPTIFLQDKLKKIKSDPGYLIRQGYIVKDQYGKQVNPYKINWHYVSKHYMPYTVRLPPSRSNPLGDIKFHLSNSKSIFMHGTPEDRLFARNHRALSSGCVRVEDEYELGAWLKYGTLSDETIQMLIRKVDEGGTKHLALNNHVPVFMSSINTWVDEKYRIQHIPGPY